MKSILTFIGIAAFLSGFSQASALLSIKNTSVSIAPNGTIELITSPEDDVKVDIEIQNSSTTATKIYIATRNIVTLNTGANAFFCFAYNCEDFANNVSGNTLTLTPGQKASSLGHDYMLTAHLPEGPVKGYSEVEYTISDVNSAKDNVKFTIIYNKELKVGLNKLNASLTSVKLYPNPSKDYANLLIQSLSSLDTEVSILNILGELVYQKDLSLNQGANTIDLTVSNLPSGIYTVNLRNSNSTISRKLVVEN
jgi:hypothetical protein